jgi:FHA domain
VAKLCPNGHSSQDADYCSECGAPMAGVAKILQPAAASLSLMAAPAPLSAQSSGVGETGVGEICPDCATPRSAGARYCEVCRYDFQAKASFDPRATPNTTPSSATPSAAPDMGQVAEAATPATSANIAPQAISSTPPPHKPDLAQTIAAIEVQVNAPRLQLRVTVDAALDTDPDPQTPCPQDVPERIFYLDLNEQTLGRQYEYQGVRPEIVIPEGEGVSRLHMRFVRDATGNYAAIDMNSSNGTCINGQESVAGVKTAIKPGDIIDIGRWTRIFVEAR